MQKISTYLYPNRIELLADLAGFTVEYTNVYQRNIKIYNGIDNTLEFDIKNPDQKRIDLSTISQIELNIMDTQGNALPNSPYAVIPLDQTTKKGLAAVTIPQEDLVDLDNQFLNFSVSALKDGKDLMLYGDTRFGAVGKMELVGNAMPTFKDARVITNFYSDISFSTQIVEHFHSDAIPVKFYEAVPTTQFTPAYEFNQLEGTVTVEATKDSSISSESFTLRGTVLDTFDWSTATMGSAVTRPTIDTTGYGYIRFSFTRTPQPTNGVWAPGTGMISKIILS